MTLDWNYDERTVDISMPNYIVNALLKFQHKPPSKPQHLPHAHIPPTYSASIQLTAPNDNPELLNQGAGIKRLQEIIGTLLYYARAVDLTMLVALGSTVASAQTNGTQATAQAVTQLLNYCATYPDATIRYHAVDMHLQHIHSDASYLSEREARSRSAGIHFLSFKPPETPPGPDDEPPPFNEPFTYSHPSS
jgi:hypothetical protein